VGFGPTAPASERGKTVHALERSVTVTGGADVRLNAINAKGPNRTKFIKDCPNLDCYKRSEAETVCFQDSIPAHTLKY
jgi:hypothetical protein